MQKICIYNRRITSKNELGNYQSELNNLFIYYDTSNLNVFIYLYKNVHDIIIL